jgi:hypothetical protein
MKYCIIPTSEIENINFAETVEFRDTLRYNIEGTEFIVKYRETKPESLEPYADYTHTEILEFINNPANGWINIK